MNYKNNYGWSKLSSADVADVWQVRLAFAKEVVSNWTIPSEYVTFELLNSEQDDERSVATDPQSENRTPTP